MVLLRVEDKTMRSITSTVKEFIEKCEKRHSDVIKELGDVGNDLQIYGSKLYAVLNSSHKVEVMDARTLVRIGQIDIPNCRYMSSRLIEGSI